MSGQVKLGARSSVDGNNVQAHGRKTPAQASAAHTQCTRDVRQMAMAKQTVAGFGLHLGSIFIVAHPNLSVNKLKFVQISIDLWAVKV
jgi:hypothetical protein